MRGVLPDDWFEREENVPLTKASIRAAALGLLLPLSGTIVLDVGAGSGGMTVEFARAVGDEGRIFAVDPDERALALAERNCRRLGAEGRVRFVHGAAPEALDALPSWNVAFVGGHGPRLRTVLEAAWKGLLPGGRLLLPAILLDTAAKALRILSAVGRPESWQLSCANGRPLAGSWMYAGQNPTFLIWLDKEA